LSISKVVVPMEMASNVVNQSPETIAPINLLCLESLPSQRANIGKVLSRYSRQEFNALL